MLLEFKIKNYLSFRDETVFSFEATSDKTLEDYYVKEINGRRIMKLAMVYGANASGKSNLVAAVEFLRDTIFSIKESRDETTGFIPFQFGEEKYKPGNFELTFFIDHIKHIYNLKIDNKIIHHEKLIYYPGTQPALIFDRQFDNNTETSTFQFGSKIKLSNTAKEQLNLKLLRNMSFFAAYSQLNIKITEIERVFNWFKNNFLDPITPKLDLIKYTNQQVQEDEKVRQFALKFLSKADFNISDIIFIEEIKKLDDEILNMIRNSGQIPEKEKEKLIAEKSFKYKNLTFEHTVEQGKFQLEDSLQSDGTLRYYSLSAPIMTMLNQNSFLSIDELDDSLHPELIAYLIQMFLKESNQAQLLFTTHNTSLLNEKDLLRKDAIWFTDKNKDGGTDLYSMADFSFRKELSWYNAYKIGKFGGVPNLE